MDVTATTLLVAAAFLGSCSFMCLLWAVATKQMRLLYAIATTMLWLPVFVVAAVHNS